MKAVRMLLLALLLSLLLGLAIGTWIRLRLERPDRYIGRSEAIEPALARPPLPAEPLDVGHARPLVLESGQHEEKVG